MKNKIRIVVLGAFGQVGRCITDRAAFNHHIVIVNLSRQQCDITDQVQLEQTIQSLCPDVVINCAAFTAVDRAETERQQAYAVNERGVQLLAESCLKYEIPLIHLSTDYVFSGTNASPYHEEDVAIPINEYGRSKLAGEQAIQRLLTRYLIIRSSWLFSCYQPNFVQSILKKMMNKEPIDVVYDQVGSPTPAEALADVLLFLAGEINDVYFKLSGIYHYCGDLVTSWYNFSCLIHSFAIGSLSQKIIISPISSSSSLRPAKRPENSMLDSTKIRSTFGLVLPETKQYLKNVIQRSIN